MLWLPLGLGLGVVGLLVLSRDKTGGVGPDLPAGTTAPGGTAPGAKPPKRFGRAPQIDRSPLIPGTINTAVDPRSIQLPFALQRPGRGPSTRDLLGSAPRTAAAVQPAPLPQPGQPVRPFATIRLRQGVQLYSPQEEGKAAYWFAIPKDAEVIVTGSGTAGEDVFMPGGSGILGGIFDAPRPLVYRANDALVRLRYVTQNGTLEGWTRRSDVDA